MQLRNIPAQQREIMHCVDNTSGNREGRTPATTDLHVLRAWHSNVNYKSGKAILCNANKTVYSLTMSALLETCSRPYPP